MIDTQDSFECDTCGTVVDLDEAHRKEPMGDVDADRWAMLCCRNCGSRLQTVLIADEVVGE